MAPQSSAIRIYKDATAIITGGASGIGRALAEDLAARGCEVVLADLQLEQAEEAAARIRAAGGKATAARLDVTDHTEFARLVKDTVARTGRLDYLFNNAGISHGMGAGARHYRIEDWRRVIDVNLGGTVNGVQAAYNVMIDQGFGHIVNTASMAGLVPSPGTTSYVTTKHAVVGLSHNLRAEAAQLGVRVSVLCPGVIRTPFIEGGTYGREVEGVTGEQSKEMWEEKKPISPEEFAKKALDAVAKNQGIIIVPGFWKLFWWLFRISPSFCLNIATKNFKDLGRSTGSGGRHLEEKAASAAPEK
ncbi:SDR family oxidoreductase [Kitasatospora sp. NBC_00240]|uniref:SDR family NAD(P)-dependent oxidoreductase n=1 Tax=Kitasatospora sp. NBC_00240 TaxID=2903567 RepID=UPI0022593B95|nr:SDR family oxidoreductase [Kitasatospora sp. NBC_00240]MCX5214366.1 SDR family oxidoreductase [Kitasatospora sp. NBC_00240]